MKLSKSLMILALVLVVGTGLVFGCATCCGESRKTGNEVRVRCRVQ